MKRAKNGPLLRAVNSTGVHLKSIRVSDRSPCCHALSASHVAINYDENQNERLGGMLSSQPIIVVGTKELTQMVLVVTQFHLDD